MIKTVYDIYRWPTPYVEQRTGRASIYTIYTGVFRAFVFVEKTTPGSDDQHMLPKWVILE